MEHSEDMQDRDDDIMQLPPLPEEMVNAISSQDAVEAPGVTEELVTPVPRPDTTVVLGGEPPLLTPVDRTKVSVTDILENVKEERHRPSLVMTLLQMIPREIPTLDEFREMRISGDFETMKMMEFLAILRSKIEKEKGKIAFMEDVILRRQRLRQIPAWRRADRIVSEDEAQHTLEKETWNKVVDAIREIENV